MASGICVIPATFSFLLPYIFQYWVIPTIDIDRIDPAYRLRSLATLVRFDLDSDPDSRQGSEARRAELFILEYNAIVLYT